MRTNTVTDEANDQRFTSLKKFYPFYLSQHTNNMCRLLHLIGTSFACYNLTSALLHLSIVYFIYALLWGYGCAWIGHFFFEQNKPATFKYPLYSFVSDYIMLYHILTGQIVEKLREYSIPNHKYFQTDLF